MTRLLIALTAAMVLAITSAGVVAASDHDEVCESPDAPGSYFCRIVYVTLVPDADINAVIDRVIPGAEPLSNMGERVEEQGHEPTDEAADRQWEVLLPEDDNALEARELLLASPFAFM